MFTAFKEWLARIERSTGRKLATLRANNGGEYVNDEFKAFCSKNGIQLQTTSPCTPEQNSIAECQNCSNFDRVRTVLADSGLPTNLWGEAVNYIVYTKNRNPTAALNGSTPFQSRYGCTPDANFFHRFGCCAYVYNDHPSRQKLNSRAKEGVFVGYADDQKAYRVYFPDTRKLVTSIHVRFHDDTNGFSGGLPEGEKDCDLSFELPSPQTDNGNESERSSNGHTPLKAVGLPNTQAIQNEPLELPQPNAQPEKRPRGRPKGSKNKKGSIPVRHSSRLAANTQPGPAEPDAQQAAVQPEQQPAAANAWGDEPAAEQHGHTSDNTSESDLTELSETEDNSNMASELPSPPSFRVYALSDDCYVIFGDEPQSYEEAMSRPNAHEWDAAMVQEIKSIVTLGTFELVDLPPGWTPIGTRWVFLIKCDPDGNIIHYKAHPVAQGFTQRPGVDFQETFAPVAKPKSIRAISAITAQRGGVIHVVDVNSAFLNSEILEGQEAYVQQPPGFVQRKSLRYGCFTKHYMGYASPDTSGTRNSSPF